MLIKEYDRILAELTAKRPTQWVVRHRKTRKLTWRFFLPSSNHPLPAQGWKVHVSASASEACNLLQQVLSVLFREEVAFKVPESLDGLIALNSGRLGMSQTGKILTVYPWDDMQLKVLANVLVKIWPTTAGPRIPSDLAVTESGSISLRYGAFLDSKVIIDPIGVLQVGIRRPDGILVPDERTTNGNQPAWASPCPLPLSRHPGGLELEGVLSVNGLRYEPVYLIQRSPKGEVLLGVRNDLRETVVIKTGRKGINGDIQGKDARDRLENEYRMLTLLQSSGITPMPIALCQGELASLIIEDLGGIPLFRLSKTDRLNCLPQFAGCIAELHSRQIVHRDIKLANALQIDDRLLLIDFELAASRGEKSPLSGGTPGYVGPESATPTTDYSADVFSLGVAIAHAYLGYDPGFLPAGAWRLVGLLKLDGQISIAHLVRALTQPLASCRPNMKEVSLLITTAQNYDKHRRAAGDGFVLALASPQWARDAALAVACSARNYSVLQPSGHCWRNEHFFADFNCEGLNIGAAGIILGLVSISQALNVDIFENDILRGCDWLVARPRNPRAAGLFMGNAGVALVLSIVGQRYTHDVYVEAAGKRLEASLTQCEAMDFYAGIAGVLWSATVLHCLDLKGSTIGNCNPLVNRLLEDAKEMDGVVVWETSQHLPGLGSHQMLGAAHGTAGIAMALATWGRLTGNVAVLDFAKDCLLRLFNYIQRLKLVTFPAALGDSTVTAGQTSWCHGVAGYLWCILQSFPQDPDFTEVIDWAVDILNESPFVSSPTYCHGLAGHLELWQMMSLQPKLEGFARLRTAKTVASLRLLLERVPGKFSWCSEESDVVTPDLWVGFLGPATALAMWSTGVRQSLLSPEWIRACAGGSQ